MSSPSWYTSTPLRSSTFLVHTTVSSTNCYREMVNNIIIQYIYAINNWDCDQLLSICFQKLIIIIRCSVTWLHTNTLHVYSCKNVVSDYLKKTAYLTITSEAVWSSPSLYTGASVRSSTPLVHTTSFSANCYKDMK